MDESPDKRDLISVLMWHEVGLGILINDLISLKDEREVNQVINGLIMLRRKLRENIENWMREHEPNLSARASPPLPQLDINPQ